MRLGHLEGRVNGVEDVRALAARFPPERVETACRVPASRIRELAREISEAESAAVYGRIGLCTQEFGTLASYLVDVVNILTGNFDREGGLMFARPVAWSVATIPE